jgi:RNA polymerase sigma-70 factor (ECF subfamily)
MRPDLAAEAIRLGRLVVELLPDQPEARGLLALMRLHHSRRDTRVAPNGELILLDEQNRALWHRDEIKDAVADLQQTLKLQRPGPYQIQASIAALHAEALVAKDTPAEKRAAILKMRDTVIAEIAKEKPELKTKIKKAAGYAVFSNVGVNLIFASFAGGSVSGSSLTHVLKQQLREAKDQLAQRDAALAKAGLAHSLHFAVKANTSLAVLKVLAAEGVPVSVDTMPASVENRRR